MNENVILFQERFTVGQYNANDLNLQELDLLKDKNSLLKQQADLIIKEIEQLNYSGNLNEFVKSGVEYFNSMKSTNQVHYIFLISAYLIIRSYLRQSTEVNHEYKIRK